MARPTKLTEELIEKARTYLPTCTDNPITTDRGALSYVEVNLPTIVGFALFLGIHKDTVYDWCKHEDNLSKQFSDIVKEIEAEQEKRLVNGSLGGLYAAKTSGMLLSKHGYAERTETDITTKGESLNPNDEALKAAALAYEQSLKEQKT